MPFQCFLVIEIGFFISKQYRIDHLFIYSKSQLQQNTKIKKPMQNFINLFRHSNPFDTFIGSRHIDYYDHISMELLQKIAQMPNQFVAFISSKNSNKFNQLQKVTLVQLIIVHTNKFSGLFEQLNLTLHSDDIWLTENILAPYQKFIRKIINSNEFYQNLRTINLAFNKQNRVLEDKVSRAKIRKHPQNYFNFDLLCYCINLLLELLNIFKKVPCLGRYYKKRDAEDITSFVTIASYQCVMLYYPLKCIVTEIITHPEKYIINEEEQEAALKQILTVQIEKINEGMKEGLMNKYFNLKDKGIRVSLLDLEYQREHNELLMRILKIDPSQQTTSQKNRVFLQKQIFRQGKFDKNMFERSIQFISSHAYKQQNLEDRCNKQNSLKRRKSICARGKGKITVMPRISLQITNIR